jgi:hypothetical protein
MKNRRFVIMVVAYAVILILIGVFQPHQVDWRPTFAATDRIPYGAYIMRERLPDIFPDSSVETVSESIYQTLHDKHFTHTNYILVEPRWNIGNEDLRELIRFANEGNNIFIASENIPYQLMDTLGIHERYTVPDYLKKITKTDTSTSLAFSLANPVFGKDSLYEFESNNIPEYFSPTEEIDTSEGVIQNQTDSTTQTPLAKEVMILGNISHHYPVYISLAVGNGHIYLHSYPYAFANYYLLKDSTRGYAEKCLSYLPQGRILWDEHYKTDPRYTHVSTLSFILTNSSLRWGYYTGVIFILIFVLFSIKRRQRIIPVVAPFRNSTLEFTQTIGRLYFNGGDHRNIAEKKIRHFLEYVRSRYYIDTHELNEDFVNKLSSKSGLEHDRIQYMTQVMRSLVSKQSIADTELIQLNNLIEYFKKHSN